MGWGSIGKAFKKAAKQTGKSIVGAGHTVGKATTSTKNAVNDLNLDTTLKQNADHAGSLDGRHLSDLFNAKNVAWVYPTQSLYTQTQRDELMKTPYPQLATLGLASFGISPTITQNLLNSFNKPGSGGNFTPAKPGAPGNDGSSTSYDSGASFDPDGLFSAKNMPKILAGVAIAAAAVFVIWKMR